MIYTERTVRITNGVANIDAPIILYRGDRQVEILFEIMDSKFKFSSEKGNYIKNVEASFGQLAIDCPDGSDVFTEVSPCIDGAVTFTITGEMIDELYEVGFYSFHIRLFNNDQSSRITIPPIMKGIEIREPIVIEGDDYGKVAMVNYGKVDEAVIENEQATFLDENGNLNIEWKKGDIISSLRLNQMVGYINDHAIPGEQGPKGDQGEKGPEGKTPVKGIDYFTEEDIESLNIPSIDGLATESFVKSEIAKAQFESADGNVDLSAYATKNYVDTEIEKIQTNLNGKLNAPSSAGQSNQMLLSDGQGGSYWADIPGMEGGTILFRTPNEGEIFTLVIDQGGTIPDVHYGQIVTSTNGLEVLEGESCSFTVSLDSAPTQNQVITIVSDVNTVIPSPSSITFTSSNYNTPVTITLNTNTDTDNTLTYCNITLSTNNENKVLILQIKEPDNPDIPTGGMITEGLVHRYDYTNLTSNTMTDTVGNDNLTINSNYILGESFGGALGYIQNNNSASATLTSTTFKEPIDSYTVLMRVSPISVSASTTILNVGPGINAGNVQLVDWGDAKLGMYCAGTSVSSSTKAFTYGEDQIIIGIAVDSATLTESIILNGSVVASEVASKTHTCQTVQPYGYQPPRNSYKYYECVVYNRALSESELISMCEYMLSNN